MSPSTVVYSDIKFIQYSVYSEYCMTLVISK
nr:MAG TPA: hypothetical protein [Caudoviricetes sp.]